MSTQDAVAATAMRLACQSWDDMTSTVQVFQANINRGDLAAADKERDKMHALIDDFVDQSLIAGRMLQQRRDR